MQIVSPVHAHRSLLETIPAQCDAREHPYFFESAIMFVVVKVIRTGIIGDVQIRPAVAIVITPDDAQAVVAICILHSSFLRDIFKRAITTIVEKKIRLSQHPPGAALNQNAFEAAVLLVTAEGRQMIHIKVNIAGNVQVYTPVAVVIGPGRAGAESTNSQASFLSDIFKLAVPQVVVEPITFK